MVTDKNVRCRHPREFLRLAEHWGPFGPLLGAVRCGLCGKVL